MLVLGAETFDLSWHSPSSVPVLVQSRSMVNAVSSPVPPGTELSSWEESETEWKADMEEATMYLWAPHAMTAQCAVGRGEVQ